MRRPPACRCQRRPQQITQAYLDRIHRDNTTYMNGALNNAALSGRLAALGPYRLRPGVEISSATADGDLTISGGTCPAMVADPSNPARRGMGEPGVLIRARASQFYGSINDGFAPPLSTDEDSRAWRLVGRLATQSNRGSVAAEHHRAKSITLRGAAAGVTTTFPNVEERIAELRRAASASSRPACACEGPTRVISTCALARCWAARSTPRVPSSPPTCCWMEPRWPPVSWLTRALRWRAFTRPRARRWASSTCSLRCRATDLAPGSYLPSGSTLRFAGSSVPLRDLDANGKQGRVAGRAMLPRRAPEVVERRGSGVGRHAPAAVHATGRRRPGGGSALSAGPVGTAGRIAHFQRHPNREGRPDILSGGDFRQTSFYGRAPCGITMATPFSCPGAGRLQP